MTQGADTGSTDKRSKISSDVNDIKTLIVGYAKQEVLDPLRNLRRYVVNGLLGALLIGIGTVFLLIAVLRVLQRETSRTFTGNWNFAPYLITVASASLVIGFCIKAISRNVGKGR